MARIEAEAYIFDQFRLDTGKRLVYGENGEPLPLKAKAFETLLYLIRNSGRVVERDELLSALWPDTIVEENNLTQHISTLRRVLGEKPDDHRYIATVPGRGYKFVAEVSKSGIDHTEDTSARGEQSDGRWRIRYILAICVLIVFAVGSSYFWWAGSRTSEAPRSIAVLPFKPLVDSQRDESLEMGMADTIISKLASTDGIVVRPLTAVRRFGAPDSDSIEAGRILGVEAVLDGTVQLVDDRVRVSAKLLRVVDSKQLWSGQFDEKLTDIFTVQDSISERVASALQVRLTQAARQHQTENPEAYQLYARGRFHALKLTPPEISKGLTYYQQAIEIDPGYALAYAGMSDGYRALALSVELPPKETFEKALVAVRKAIELDQQSVEGHTTLGSLNFWYTRDWIASEAEFKTALALDPNSAMAHLHYAHLLSNLGRHAEAVEHARRARSIDPVSPFVSTLEGLVLLHADRPDDAMAMFGKAAEVDPTFWMPHMFGARAYLQKGMFREAEMSSRRATDLSPAQSISTAYESYAAAKLGNREKAQALLDELLQRSREKYVPPYHLAIAYMGLDDRENTLAYLERGVADNDTKVTFLKVERIWDEIRSEPRFIELLRRMKFE